MSKKVKIAPLYINGELVYPKTRTDAVYTPSGKTSYEEIEEIKKEISNIGSVELKELKEIIDNVALFDEEEEVTDVIGVDADTLGGVYTAAHIKNLIDTVELQNQIIENLKSTIEILNNRVSKLESGSPVEPEEPPVEEPPVEVVLDLDGSKDTGYYTTVDNEDKNIQNVTTQEIELDGTNYIIDIL